jgi:RNA polymerase sigma factor (sigma-70 family)
MTSRLIHQVRRAALLRQDGGFTDGQLLGSFIERRDEAAFEALVRRHGPMVLGVCRRVLRNGADAEDAFQATFLVLARKAASLRARELVGNWLYGAAYRTAMQARATIARRQAREKQVQEMPDPQVESEPDWRELLPLLDRELSKLPDKYRVPVVLCDLEGKSRKEVARLLGVPEGRLSWRLAHARKLLAGRLARYGLTVSGGALAAGLSERTASAAVTQALAASTARAAGLAAAGHGLTAGAVPARVVALAEGVIKTMFLLKLRTFVALAVVTCVGAGVVGLAYRTTAAEPTRTTAAAPAAADDLEALRLEVEALRKSLQATRERVKTLEGEVQGLKEKAKTSARPEGETTSLGIEVGRVPLHLKTTTIAVPAKDVDVFAVTTVADPLSEAEAALKKLKEHPDDKQAADALEKALQRLKEQPKVEHRLWQLQQLKEQPKPEGQPENPDKKP